MVDFTHARIEQVSAHFVGNKAGEQPLLLSEVPLDLTVGELEGLLKKFFLEPFEGNEYFAFDFPNGDLTQNPVREFCRDIFERPSGFHGNSVNMARHLYERSVHPKIKGGDFFVVSFSGILYGEEVLDAVGMIKSENKQAFLKLEVVDGSSRLVYDFGNALDKMDKGCLVLQTETNDGYRLLIVDKANRAVEAQYWREEFLGLRPVPNNYFHTEQFIHMTKDFVVNKLSEDFPVHKADQIDMLNKSMDYLKEHDYLVGEEFAKTVFEDEQVQEAFLQHRQAYQDENNLPLEPSFGISPASLKKQLKVLKSVLKLDKNFHIYIHGDRQLIERGFDEERGKHYYKVYFEEEN